MSHTQSLDASFILSSNICSCRLNSLSDNFPIIPNYLQTTFTMSTQVIYPSTGVTSTPDQTPKPAPNVSSTETQPPKDQLPQDLVNAMQAIFGKHPGYRTSKFLKIIDLDSRLTICTCSSCQRSSRGGHLYANRRGQGAFHSCSL